MIVLLLSFFTKPCHFLKICHGRRCRISVNKGGMYVHTRISRKHTHHHLRCDGGFQAQEAGREEKKHLTGLRKRLDLLAQPPPPPPPPPPPQLTGSSAAAAAAAASFAVTESPGGKTRLDRFIVEYLLREVRYVRERTVRGTLREEGFFVEIIACVLCVPAGQRHRARAAYRRRYCAAAVEDIRNPPLLLPMAGVAAVTCVSGCVYHRLDKGVKAPSFVFESCQRLVEYLR